MAKAVTDSGHTITSPWVLGQIETADPKVLNVFERDKSGAESCDLLLADVSDPSVGVGMEIMAAHIAGKKVIVVARRGKPASRMLSHMDGKQVLEYFDEGEIYEGLVNLLKSQPPC